jgi:hypothetical protein
MKKLFFAFVLLIVGYANSTRCLGQDQSLTSEIRKETIEELAALVRDRYAYKEVGEKLQRLLKQNLLQGKYDRYTNPSQFSIAVTNDLRLLSSDRHLALNYAPRSEPANTNVSRSAPTLTPEEQAKRASAFNRQMNFGFKNVEFLNGNIGYLKFDYFDAFLNYSSPVVDAAMGFLRNCDVIILDLRYNGGGSPQMVAYIAGFFFKERTLAGVSYDRLSDETTKTFIEPQPEGKLLLDVDLYVLTSRATISAAEGLAYDLKYLKNATVVGEPSAGAANPGRVTRINSSFTAFIPNRHGMNVVTGKNWEGTGVPVDILCPAEDALRVARLEALKQLLRKTTDEFQRRRYSTYITYLEKVDDQPDLAVRTLRQYAGEYEGGRTVSLKDRKLFYTRAAEAGGQLLWIAPDIFMLSEGDTTIKFTRDKKNRVTGMETKWSLSSSSQPAAKVR